VDPPIAAWLSSGTLLNLATRSAISRPGLNVTTALAGTATVPPVLGLRARLGFRCLISNTPKFRNSMRPSLSSVSTIPSNTRCTMSNACAWVTPNPSAIALAMSFLVTVHPLKA
jgi:hypothetical protein